ncbi:uncharacterized protein JCM6883_007545 [Sporobolomyces salmoneus]|uniref:uncharacterized protein n=1 Tax=Sporobolomyces salmoneus TaxID=183962 RepID=UPI003174E459
MSASLPLHRSGSEKPSITAVAKRKWYDALRAEPGTTKYTVKNHFIAMLGEFVGTTLFLLFALGGANVASRASTAISGGSERSDTPDNADAVAQVVNTSNLLYIALSFAVSLTINVWIFFRVSGGLFNPAVTFTFWLCGIIKPLRAILLVISQTAGAVCGSALVLGLLPGSFNVQTTLSGNTSITRGVFIEMFLTAMLMLAILMLAAEKSRSTFIAPIGIGMALFVAEMLGVAFTGGAVNPARAFGPAVVTGSFVGYHYIYWVGPLMGSIIASGFYRFIKFLEYETCLGPDCDGDGSCAISAPMQAPAASLMGPAPVAPRMNFGMSTDPGPGAMGTFLGVHRSHHGSRMGADNESINRTLNNTVEKDQLDRIEVMLAQLVSTGKVV